MAQNQSVYLTIVGSAQTGKLLIAHNYQNDQTRPKQNMFLSKQPQTISSTLDFTKVIRMDITILSGYNILTQQYFAQMLSQKQGVLIVFDVARYETFVEAKRYLGLFQNYKRMLIGNQIDKANIRSVSYEEGLELASSFEILYLETSGLYGWNIKQAINSLIGVAMSKDVRVDIIKL